MIDNMTIEQRTQVMDTINIQCIINAQIDKKGECEHSLADRLEELIDEFTADQEDLFVIKMSHKNNKERKMNLGCRFFSIGYNKRLA